jgi:CRISPR/Cas system-associated protein endoribonuclease Cas2
MLLSWFKQALTEQKQYSETNGFLLIHGFYMTLYNMTKKIMHDNGSGNPKYCNFAVF